MAAIRLVQYISIIDMGGGTLNDMHLNNPPYGCVSDAIRKNMTIGNQH